MKILLISFENTLVCFGVRMISAVLKRAGYETHILFLPREFNDLETDSDVMDIAQWVEDLKPDLIGISLMSSHLKRVLPVHQAIRKNRDIPIIWGGIHPTIRPEECLQYTDFVCVGEGELPMRDLAQALAEGKEIGAIPNIWSRSGETIIKPEPRPWMENLDDLPYADHDPEHHRVRHQNRIQSITPEIWNSYIPGFMDTHYVMSSRGCPHNCTYCCNSALRSITCGDYLRRRSPEHFVGELVEIKEKIPSIRGFVFMDDSFFYGNAQWFTEFCAAYKSQVNLPFYCWANPLAVTESRIKPLADAGMVGVHVGLESGSERVSGEVYKRKVSRTRFFECMDILHKYRRKISDIRVDVITDNPYETETDVAATAEVLSRLKKPFFVGIVSLIFYPQTELETRAVRDGLINSDDDELYYREFFHYRPTLLNRLMRATPMTPGRLIRFFLGVRHTAWGRALFYLYYFGYFIAIRRQIRDVRRKVTLFLFRKFGDRFKPDTVLKQRVALIDF